MAGISGPSSHKLHVTHVFARQRIPGSSSVRDRVPKEGSDTVKQATAILLHQDKLNQAQYLNPGLVIVNLL